MRTVLIIRRVVAHGALSGDDLPIDLIYDPDDPYAARFRFHPGTGRSHDWVFARDLLKAGQYCNAGWGKARIWPCPNQQPAAIAVALTTHRVGQCLIYLPAKPLRRWLDRTYEVVPADTEHLHLNIDACIAQMFAEETKRGGTHEQQ